MSEGGVESAGDLDPAEKKRQEREGRRERYAELGSEKVYAV